MPRRAAIRAPRIAYRSRLMVRVGLARPLMGVHVHHLHHKGHVIAGEAFDLLDDGQLKIIAAHRLAGY
jgi:hypothetical protein